MQLDGCPHELFMGSNSGIWTYSMAVLSMWEQLPQVCLGHCLCHLLEDCMQLMRRRWTASGRHHGTSDNVPFHDTSIHHAWMDPSMHPTCPEGSICACGMHQKWWLEVCEGGFPRHLLTAYKQCIYMHCLNIHLSPQGHGIHRIQDAWWRMGSSAVSWHGLRGRVCMQSDMPMYIILPCMACSCAFSCIDFNAWSMHMGMDQTHCGCIPSHPPMCNHVGHASIIHRWIHPRMMGTWGVRGTDLAGPFLPAADYTEMGLERNRLNPRRGSEKMMLGPVLPWWHSSSCVVSAHPPPYHSLGED